MKFIKYTLLLLLTASCSYSREQTIETNADLKLRKVEFSELHGWLNDDHKAALLSFLNSCERFKKMKNETKVGNKIGEITVADFRDVCRKAELVKFKNSDQIRNFFENSFIPFEVSDKRSNNIGKFTGYFEPILEGSFTKDDVYQHPIYTKPDNYEEYSRKDIENGALLNKGLEILYAKDKVDLFFMHVQGTGKIILPNGEVLKLAYNGKNNYPYQSIGKNMMDRKVIENGNYSYNSMKQWLRDNSQEAQNLMNLNKSYVFFKISDDDRVIGAQMVPLTPERSLAIDKNLLPYGYPIWLEVKSKINDNLIYNKLLVTQDTGTAITGAVRGDVYFGTGEEAQKFAAKMNNSGSYYIFLPVNAALKLL